ncbi:MAG: class I SAM-dependent methyltransferase [Paraburkholderia sp.]|jgi:SAM-dependent methyltransferase|uniref:class I SAM-dependent methyltransferase n=1 Tax=Burkholderiaceae TaxID=119060 RepID=UPI0010F58538|nr:class I SAM-dependent methyltransferase [Burkholderia sp. 4M9327F10]
MSTYFDKEHLQQHYATIDDFKSRSDDWESLAKRSISQWYVGQLQDLRFTRVLDAGSGLGRFGAALAESRPVNVSAIDIAREMVEATRKRFESIPGDHRFIQSSIEEAPFENGSFDLVLANLLLHHVPDIKAAFSRLAQLTRAGGHVALLTAAFDWMSELNRFQDRALLELGFPYDHVYLTAPGTNRFCDANIAGFVPESLELVRQEPFDGTMTFPNVDRLLDFYVRTLRYKNIAQQLGDESLRNAVRKAIEIHWTRTGSLDVSSTQYLYVFRKR